MKIFNHVLRHAGLKLAHTFDRVRRPSDYSMADSIIQKYRDNGGLRHEFQAYKLVQLSDILRENSPESILELGSGTTTSVFVEYVRQSTSRQLTTIDEHERWLENSLSISGVISEDTQITAQKSSVISRTYPPSTSYSEIPQGDFDLVFVDGPSLIIDGIRRKDAVNLNIFSLIDQKPPKIIVVDVRRATATALSVKYGNLYRVYLSDIFRDFPGIGYRYFSIFVLDK